MILPTGPKKLVGIILTLLAAMVTSQAGAQQRPPGVPPPPIPVLLDTDIGTDIDDAFALVLVLRSSELDLTGVTTVSGDTQARARLTARLLIDAGRALVPVAAGEPGKPLPIEQTRLGDGVEGPPILTQPAVEFMKDQIEQARTPLTLVAIGPLTNVAQLITRYPATARKLKQIVMMGGSIAFGYGASHKPVAEYNIASDAKAAQVVFGSGIPILMAPLDATAMLDLDADARQRIFDHHTALTDDLARLYPLWGHPTPILFDPLAVAILIDPSLCRTKRMALAVDDKGFTRVRRGSPNALVALSSDKQRFLQLLLGRIAP
ncbi:MAG TPA: nucleoside hydrolase [Terriglobia bacterium]|nr:nucleoside hydrolase [Terriglobia bacterium]